MTNAEIARYLDEIAFWLEVEGENPFRARAYSTAARSIRANGEKLADYVERGDELPKVQGVGKDLSSKVREIVGHGEPALLKRLRAKQPSSLVELKDIPGFGPKRIALAYEKLGIQTKRQLKEAAKDGRLRQLSGIGPAAVEKILTYLEQDRGPREFIYAVAKEEASAFLEYLANRLDANQAAIAGEVRRGKATVSELSLVIETAIPPQECLERLEGGPMMQELFLHERALIGKLLNGLPFRVRIAAPGRFGIVLMRETATPDYWHALSGRASEYGYRLDDDGLYEGGRLTVSEDESRVYSALELDTVPPELQETSSVVHDVPPRLVERGDLRGDLHSHTTETDGKHTLEQMAEAARAEGLEYLAVTDHSRRLAFINGLDPVRLRRQMDSIDRLNDRISGIRLLKGVEVDILEDGALDLPNEVLRETDIVVASVHGWFDLAEEKQTERLLRVMENPYVTVLGHPSGRRIGARNEIRVNMGRVLETAASHGVFLEINGQPQRMDLEDRWCRVGKSLGVRFALDSDAHSVHGFRHLEYGLTQARRGGLEKNDVVTTLPLKHFLSVIQERRP